MNARLLVSAPLGNGESIELSGDRARYVGRVLRLKPGDMLNVFNAEDGEFAARIETVGRDAVGVIIGEAVQNDVESPLKLHLVQGISRGDRMDFVVQKATELGVKRITPVMTDHGVVKLDGKRRDKRRLHWQKVAESACEQCGRVNPPLIDEPLPLNDWFGRGRDVDSTELVLRPDARTTLADVEAIDTKLCLLIGPEGGFSEREYEDASVAGFSSVALGPRILRTETAAVAALTIAQSKWGDLSGRPGRG